MLSMRERVPLLRQMASEVGNACRCAGNVRPLDDSSLAASVFIKMLLYHFIGKFLVASRPKRHRLAQIYLLRLGAGCRDSSLFQFTSMLLDRNANQPDDAD